MIVATVIPIDLLSLSGKDREQKIKTKAEIFNNKQKENITIQVNACIPGKTRHVCMYIYRHSVTSS